MISETLESVNMGEGEGKKCNVYFIKELSLMLYIYIYMLDANFCVSILIF